MLGAVSVATAALLPGSPAAAVLDPSVTPLVIEHPTGTFDTVVELREDDGDIVVEGAAIVRTARKLMDGVVYPRAPS